MCILYVNVYIYIYIYISRLGDSWLTDSTMACEMGAAPSINIIIIIIIIIVDITIIVIVVITSYC